MYQNISNHPRHYASLSGNVEERYGPGDEADFNRRPDIYFKTFDEAMEACLDYHAATRQRDLKRVADKEKRLARFDSLTRFTWGKLRADRKRRSDKFRSIFITPLQKTPEPVKIVRLPQSVPVKGHRLVLGQKLFIVDPFNGTLSVFTVDSIKFAVYGFGSSAEGHEYYTCNKNKSRNSSVLSSRNIKPDAFVYSSMYYCYDAQIAYDYATSIIAVKTEALEEIYKKEQS